MAIWRTLNRTFKNRFSISFARALITGVLSFGIVPVFSLSRRFRDYILFERQQMDHLADWLRSHHETEEANALRNLSKRIRFREQLHTLSFVLAIFTVAALLFLTGPFSLRRLIDHTYEVRPFATARLPLTFVLWNALLCAAYGLHWLQIRLYIRDLRRFVEQFNRVAGHDKLEPVNPPRLKLGMRVGWILTAVLLACVGAFWGIPMALAGASQRRYINQTAQHVREQMGERVRTMMGLRGPAPVVAGATPHYRVHTYRCDRDNCRANLPAAARFCPRCGAPVVSPADPIHDDSVGGPA